MLFEWYCFPSFFLDGLLLVYMNTVDFFVLISYSGITEFGYSRSLGGIFWVFYVKDHVI